ncbi:very long-chain acyl-CoA synthetase-like [Tachysurus fulvidraco]|uniref:very long-chain acyl-CoA synthetase-like n=1 Tax=Tachysurus fulvidraco TaxID=1234273 RepID=UPI001FEDE769|nr:very long-chain acyl-CoA synthetase-like [Tachysurus fulvidraco]XP_047678089.1 very long-chain acyl-CoA synthetase-like [Tachysurus fulvidraco]
MDTLFTLAVFSFSFLLFFIKFPYFLHDCVFMMKSLRVRSKRMNFRKSVPYYTVLDCFVAAAHRHPHKPFVVFEDDVYTYQQVDRWSNRAAHALRKHTTLREGDTAALLMANEPHFIFLCLGLMKIGCSTSLLNTNIRGKSLTHCFLCCEAKVLIAGAEYRSAVCEVLPELRKRGVSVFLLCDNCDFDGVQSLKDKMDISEDGPVSHTLRANITMKSPAFYIYTSGTTGLPKAGVILHERIWSAAFFQSLFGVKPDDVIYIPLPLYHAAGLIIGLGGAIERGITVVLRKKFSVSQFWTDCRKHNVTVIQYIGEIMRYLCNTPKRDADRQHSVRLAIGNGLRAEVWQEFQCRFGVKKIGEFYGASDGNMSFLNYTGKVGAVGKVNFLQRKLNPHALIQFDHEIEAPVRDSRGRCVPVRTGETGLLVCKITEITPFAGYSGNPEQTEKKKLRNVFEDGDVYLNSGDLLRTDHHGFMYFQDRVGDTFRWKGENVATSEVAGVISALDVVEDVCVYGVKVPGHEGRVGMAALTLKEEKEFDGEKAFSHITNFLPAYARPCFIRILRSMEMTGTFKQVKISLMKDGFDPERVTPPIYFLKDNCKSYIPLTHTHYNAIISGEICF